MLTTTNTTTATSTTTTTTPIAALRNPGVAAVNKSAGPTFFCYAVVISQGSEKRLMIVQLQQGTGIFGCHAYSIFSDTLLDLGLAPDGRVVAVAVPGEPAWFAPIPGTGMGAWHNTNVFLRAWLQIRQAGIHEQHDWTVKVDPDTVFLPGRLQYFMGEKRWLDPATPLYLLNCQEWRSLQGPLEVISRAAARTFFTNLDACTSSLEWWSWGEDWFVQHCLDLIGVQKNDGFDLLDDMWCNTMYWDSGHSYLEEVALRGPTCSDGRPAYHPYKTPEAFLACLGQAVG